MPSVCYVPIYYFVPSFVYLYLVSLCLQRIGNFLAYIAALYVTMGCLLAFVAERTGCYTPIFEVADSKPICIEVLLTRGLILFLLFHLVKRLFCRVLASLCEAQLRLYVMKLSILKELEGYFVR